MSGKYTTPETLVDRSAAQTNIFKRITGDHYAPYPSVMPTPEPSNAELHNQIAALRTELRDGRLLQAKQRSELNQESARVSTLKRKYQDVKRERSELKAKLNYERDEVLAVRKRLSVAVKNHAEAQDKCARTMVECERLRIVNKELTLLNKGLGAPKHEVATEFHRKLKEVEDDFKIKLEEAEAAFMRELEVNEQRLLHERRKETQALQKELDSRDAKIKKLERDFDRQCEINAMFTIDYDRDTNFTKHLYVPLSVPATVTSGVTSGPIISNRTYGFSPRRPLSNIEGNQDVQSRKRARSAILDDEKAGHSPLKSSKLSKADSPGHAQNTVQKRASPDRLHQLLKGFQQLPTPDSSLRMSKRHN